MSPTSVFFDGGRAATVTTLQELLGTPPVPPLAPAGREVIVVSPVRDEQLRKCVTEAQAAMDAAVAAHGNTTTVRAEALAAYCAERLGGKGTTVAAVDAHIKQLQAAEGGRRGVALGMMTKGVCRHRSILFKFLCDQPDVNIACRLVRGEVEFEDGTGGGHAWNVVRVDDDDDDDGGGMGQYKVRDIISAVGGADTDCCW